MTVLENFTYKDGTRTHVRSAVVVRYFTLGAKDCELSLPRAHRPRSSVFSQGTSRQHSDKLTFPINYSDPAAGPDHF